MTEPNVCSTVKDAKNNVTYRIMAYRKLSKEEMLDCVSSYLSQRRRKKREKNVVITIITVFGCDEEL